MGPDLAEGIILARDFALIFHRMMVTLRGNRSRCAPAQAQTRECHVAPPTLFRRSNDIQPNVRGFRHWHILWAARALLCESLMQTRELLNRLELRVVQVARAEQREVVRLLYVATRNQAKALAACLELQGLE